MKEFIGLFYVLGLLLLIGCTDIHVENEANQLVKTKEIKISEPLDMSSNEDFSVPLKISEIKSVSINLNDSVSETPLRGVRYEVSMLSEKEITNEDIATFNFVIVTNSSLKESIGPIQPLYLTDTSDGYLYTLAFETIYRDYSKNELEELNKERNFQIFLNYKGLKEIQFL